jgi:hypothetical protein
MDRTVTVWGAPHTIKVDQASRARWSATGEYGGQMLFGHGPTASAAMASWSAAAKSLGRKRA